MFIIQLFELLKDLLNFHGFKTIYCNIFYRIKTEPHYRINILLNFKISSFSLIIMQPFFYLI